MTRSITLIIVVTLVGCSDGSPTAVANPPGTNAAATQPTTASVMYDPATFRADITRYIGTGQFNNAVALVNAADVNRQLKFDATGYLAVGGER